MGRVIHFGVVPTDRSIADTDIPEIRHLVREYARHDRLSRGFLTDGDSFTEWGEALREEGDALHVIHVTDCDSYDEDGERIRFSREEVAEVAGRLAGALAQSGVYRVVDYWLEDDSKVHGSDVHAYGPFALETGPARLTY